MPHGGPPIESLPLPATIALFILGVGLVIKGADLFVAASVSIARHARIPNVVIGSTLVSLATTSPELAVSATASLRGNPGLAIGNAVGSAIANIGLILGLLCILRPMNVLARDFRVPSLAMLAGGILLFFLPQAGQGGAFELRRWAGVVLLALGAAYLFTDYWRHRPKPDDVPETAAADERPAMGLGKSAALFFLGAAMVIVGSRLLSDNGVVLARRLGVPPMIIGLTLVAMGTSLPELVTAISAARKGVPELSLGNVVGANIMNITLVTGTATVLSGKPLAMSRAVRFYNFPAMLAVFVLLLVVARTGHRLTRREGWCLVAFYALYLVGLILLRG